jgi:predicted tellurium resistance membrane protein TerC
VERLPPEQRDRGRCIGIFLALVTRLALLSVLAWVIGLTSTLFALFDYTISILDAILIGGGLFLLTKATREIHEGIEGEGAAGPAKGKHAAFGSVIAQIAVLDIVFSIDSVITAIGMVDELLFMFSAVILAVIVMLIASGPVARFVAHHPTVKMLAFSFLLLIGTTLVADGLGFHMPKGYLYAAMAFSAFVELLNTFARKRKISPKSARK